MSEVCTYPKCDCPRGPFDLNNSGQPYSCPKRPRFLAHFVNDTKHNCKAKCHKCHSFIREGEEITWDDPSNGLYGVWFHKDCYNPYEHYYGLDKPLD